MAIPWLHAPSRLDRDAILDMQVAGQSEPVYERGFRPQRSTGGLSAPMEGDHGMNGDPSDPRGTGTTPEEAEGERDTRSTPEIVRSTIWYAIGAVLLTLAGLWFLDQQRTLINYLILAVLLALALEPAVIWLHEKRGWRRGSATGLLLVVLFVASVLFVVGLAAVIARESAAIVEELPTYVDKLNDVTKDKFDTTVISADQRAAAANAATEIVDFLKEHQEEFLGGIASGLSAIFVLFTVGLFTFYRPLRGRRCGARSCRVCDRNDSGAPCSPWRRRSRRWEGTCIRGSCWR